MPSSSRNMASPPSRMTFAYDRCGLREVRASTLSYKLQATSYKQGGRGHGYEVQGTRYRAQGAGSREQESEREARPNAKSLVPCNLYLVPRATRKLFPAR